MKKKGETAYNSWNSLRDSRQKDNLSLITLSEKKKGIRKSKTKERVQNDQRKTYTNASLKKMSENLKSGVEN